MACYEDGDENVDVVREQERRARLQLLDEIREPSPQPIFGEPVKVELEDETSRRLKNTLGDFTQVLTDKNLLGISRTASSTASQGGTQTGRNSTTSKRPPIVNGIFKPSITNNTPKHPTIEKRPGYPRNKPHDSMNCPTSLHSDFRLKDKSQWEKSHLRNVGASPSVNGANLNYNSVNPACPNSSNSASIKVNPHHGRNGTVSNTAAQAPKFVEGSSSAPPPKRLIIRPLNKLPERRPEKPVESPKKDQDLETILREMKQAVPPPLTAIQTPRTEESGFPFPDVSKEEVPPYSYPDRKIIKSPEIVPQPPEPPKSKEEPNFSQNTPSPLLKRMDNMHIPADVVGSCPINGIEPGPKEPDTYNCISSSLQEDLEMSDSDDEIEVISEFKSTDAKNNGDTSGQQYPKSPLNSGVASANSSSAVNNSTMDVPQSVPSNSSDSSDSGDSDSDDSSSESNDSDSSASSEASDADTPSKMWGLSNFFDETRRNHSPAFVPMDTSTNSSTAVVKEESVAARQDARESYPLMDNAAANGTLKNHVGDRIPKFLELDPSVNIKNEILSPITSPLHKPGPSAPLLPPPPLPPPPPPPPVPSNSQAIRGPRTPPSPSYSTKDEPLDANKSNASSENNKSENSVTAELASPLSQTVKHSGIQQNSCDMKEEAGKVQTAVSKKRLSKNKSEIFSPRIDSSPVSQSFEDDEPSASKGLNDMSIDKDESCVATLTTSYSVPSETSDSSHDNYSIKTRQKVLKSSAAKKSKTVCEEPLSQNCQKGTNASKSTVSKVKHPSRTRRTSDDAKQLSKTVKSSKSDPSEEVKKPNVKHDLREKCSSEKNKNSSKSASNLKGSSKNSAKIKKKPLKPSSKQAVESKKSEIKKKKSKFHIENFLQSPTVSQSESGLLLKVPSILSPSPERSPIPSYKNSVDSKRKQSVSPHASRSPSKSTSKAAEKGKSSEKLRRSTRCSERASSIAQAESSALANQVSDLSKKSIKRTPKQREHVESSLLHVEVPPSLLSPIPHNSPIPATISECAIPTKITVSIPLDKITRLPSAIHALGSENKSVTKKSHPDENTQKKDFMPEKSSRNASNKRALSKDIKYKSRTESDSKSKGNKLILETKKDKNSKTLSESSSSVKSKTSANYKISIKSTESKQSWNSENKSSKKRKNEDDKQLSKKKVKTHTDTSQDRNQSARTDSPNNLNPSTSKSKSSERRDSVSSLSSLSSQISQRSSKEKRKSVSSDTREKIVPVKHIKQEKDDKMPKVTIKKEPSTPEKCKETSRDKILPKEIEKNIENMWNDPSSQYSPWRETCKDDPKGLPIPPPLIDSMNRICSLDWENDGKGLKDASNHKHNNPPIMPMDYYYTEGRKQRHLAEKEKDPFAQTLKFFEATVLFILTSQQREEYTKEPESVYQFYRETLNFSKYVSNLILENVRLQQCSPGSMEFKVLVLLLRCQALLHVKLYNLKLKEIKEQQKHVSEFFHVNCPATVRSLTHPVANSRTNLKSIPSPPSPASSVNSQTSGYSSSDVTSCLRNLPHYNQTVTVTQAMLETICRQHTHLTNLHMGHDLWEQADMYMTRSNLREFFREVADQSENLTLHSSIKDLVNYVQCGISLVKKCCR